DSKSTSTAAAAADARWSMSWLSHVGGGNSAPATDDAWDSPTNLTDSPDFLHSSCVDGGSSRGALASTTAGPFHLFSWSMRRATGSASAISGSDCETVSIIVGTEGSV